MARHHIIVGTLLPAFVKETSARSSILHGIFFKETSGASTADLLPSLLTNGQTFPAATVTTGAVDLAPSLLSEGNSFPAATVTSVYALTASLLTDGDTFFDATVTTTYALTAALFTNAVVFHAPAVTPGAIDLTPDLFTNTNAFHAPALSTGGVTVAPPLFSADQTFFAATVGATYPLLPALLTVTQAFPSATVDLAGTEKFLFPPLLENISSFPGPGEIGDPAGGHVVNFDIPIGLTISG